MDKVDAVREQALIMLMKIFQDKSYSNILIKNLGKEYSALDRSFITEIVYGTVKWKLKIDNIIKQFSKIKPAKMSSHILNILRIGIYQLDYMDKVPESAAVNESVKLASKYGNPGAVKFVNGLLRNYLRNKESVIYPDRALNPVQYLSVYYSYPEWLVGRLIDEFGFDFTEEFLQAGNEIPQVTVRVNNLKTQKRVLKGVLTEKGIEAQDGKYIEDALILKGIPGIENMEEYKEGLFTVQDESSMLAAFVLSPEPGNLVLDVCSAPGTKTTYIAELMKNKGCIVAGDISARKLKLVEQNASRLGIHIIDTTLNDASSTLSRYLNKADRVLIDAPCSGLGLLRKKPEIRWNRTAEDIREIEAVQEAILDASCEYLKVGGVMVYSTCTILRDENYNMIDGFLKKHRNYVLEDITDIIPDKLKKESANKGYIELYPNIDGIDGFFIARLRRVE